MPDMDGFALAQQIKKRPRLTGASIMMLTSGPRPGDRTRCLALGMAAYLTKPIKQSDLLDTIMDVTSGRPASRRLRPSTRRSRGGRRLRVLVAEDNPVNQEVAVGMLEREGHRTAVAVNGREALALLEGQAFDLVLMDVQMPELDGFETTAAIREQEKTTGAHLPIIAVTAHAMKGDAERCLAAGMDSYLSKPLDAHELRRVLASLGRERPSRAAPAKDAVPGHGPLDESKVLDRVGGDRQALARLVRLFAADSRTLMTRVHAAVKTGEAAELRAAAHALKGSVSNFAAPAAAAAAARLQQIAEGGNLAEAETARERLRQELARVRQSLSALVKTPSSRRRRKPQLSRGT